MRDISSMEGVFVRSMATRGSLGGLSPAVRDVVKIMDAFGKDIILIETVGVGQDEVEIVKTADIVIVLCVPGQGDGIQAIKAGIMEIADIFVVNKADREGAGQVMADIQSMLAFATDESSQNIPVLKTVATTGEGIADLSETLSETFQSNERDLDKQEKQVRDEIFSLLEKEVALALHHKWSQEGELDIVVKQILAREKDPYSLVQEMTGSLIRN
jgi:LAO/AO transport system kinase